MRKNRIERFLSKDQFIKMTKNPKKADYQRKVLIFDTKITQTKVLQLQSYFDKQTCQPVVFAISDPHLIQSHPNDPNNRNITKILTGNERPPISEYYNAEMGYTDEFDRECGKYTTACLPVGRRADKTHWTKKTTAFLFDIFIQNVFSLWRKRYLEQNPSATKLPYRFRQNFQIEFAKQLLRKKTNPIPVAVDLENPAENPPKKRRVRRDCQTCIENFDAKIIRSFHICQCCGKFICTNHQFLVCKTCFCSHVYPVIQNKK